MVSSEGVDRVAGPSRERTLLLWEMAVPGTRLTSLDDLASKGVHTQVSRVEAQFCVSWTFMLAADLLRIASEARSGDQKGTGTMKSIHPVTRSA